MTPFGTAMRERERERERAYHFITTSSVGNKADYPHGFSDAKKGQISETLKNIDEPGYSK